MSQSSTRKTSNKQTGFIISIFDSSWTTHPYTYKEIWPILNRFDLNKSIYTIESNDIEIYNWHENSFVLTNEGAKRFNTIFENIKSKLHNKYFIVSLEGEKLYGGVFYLQYGAAGIQFPVIDKEFSDNNSYSDKKFIIFAGINNRDSESFKVIRQEKIKNYLKMVGKLSLDNKK